MRILLILLILFVTLGSNFNYTDTLEKEKVDTSKFIMYDSLGTDNVIDKTAILERHISVAPHSVQVYFYTKKYCKEYGVPEEIAFSVARLETYYLGPNSFNYNPSQTSYANAYGTYQLLLSTARYMYEGDSREITPHILLTNVKLNTRLGIKYLKYLYDTYRSWIIACGFYNTGYPKINQYARDAVKYYNRKNT